VIEAWQFSLSGNYGTRSEKKSFVLWSAKAAESACVKSWEIIVDRLSKAGWGMGWVSAIDCQGRTIWIVDAHRSDGDRYIVRADEKLTAFLELESAIRDCSCRNSCDTPRL
jgi:hypothetical protein